MLREDGERSSSHGLPVSLIRTQASALGIPLVVRCASWDDYEAAFACALRELKERGIEAGVFGDVDIDAHREWVERVCGCAGIRPYHPLWKRPRRALLGQFVEAGFKAVIVVVKEGVLDRRFLGKSLDADVVREIEALGIDASGEGGEYHTVVTDGPIFSVPLGLHVRAQVVRDGYCLLDVAATTSRERS